jgi:hypothetical protein
MIRRATTSGPAFAAEAGFRRHLLEEHAVPVAPGPTFAPAPHSRGPRATAEAEPRTAAILHVAARAAEALP